MIVRFKCCVCCALVLALQFTLLPLAANAAAEGQVTTVEPVSAPAPQVEPVSTPAPPAEPAAAPSLQPVPAPVSAGVSASLPGPADTLPTTGDDDPAPAPDRTLAELIGTAEVPVMADFDGQFAKYTGENQLLGDDFASHVGETDLLTSIRAGRGFNRESLAAQQRTEQAEAQTGQALGLLLPTVAVRVSLGSETSEPSVKIDQTTGKPVASDTHYRRDTSLSIRQPLLDLPSFLDWRRRKVLEQARKENYRVSDGDAYVATVTAYLSLVSSRLQADITRDFETQLDELLSYIEKRASAGAASISDSARVQARSQATLSSRLEQEAAHAAAGIEFVRLTNIVPQRVRLPVAEDVGASSLPTSFDRAVATAMQSNPEIAALNAELRAAKLDESAAESRFQPRIDAEYTDSFALHAGGDVSPDGQRDRRTMIVMNLNLFNGGRDLKNHTERAARHKELQYRLDDQRRRVVQSLSANYATLATTRERIASGYLELKSISTATEAMSKRMISGNQSLLDLLDVYDRFYQIRSRLVSLHILEMSTVTQLIRLTRGTPESSSGVAPLAMNTAAPHENQDRHGEDN